MSQDITYYTWLSLETCVNLGKLLNLSVPQFKILCALPHRLVIQIKEVNICKVLKIGPDV